MYKASKCSDSLAKHRHIAVPHISNEASSHVISQKPAAILGRLALPARISFRSLTPRTDWPFKRMVIAHTCVRDFVHGGHSDMACAGAMFA
jgi:hypothetical protein